MSDGPEARIRAGSPTPEEEGAVLAALERIWSEERAKAASAAGRSGWVTAARLEATRRSASALRDARAWRLSGVVGGDPATLTQTGRGDAK